jgi:hypothetical protein
LVFERPGHGETGYIRFLFACAQKRFDEGFDAIVGRARDVLLAQDMQDVGTSMGKKQSRMRASNVCRQDESIFYAIHDS